MKIGDLVVVEKPRKCCGSTELVGRIFSVSYVGDGTIIRCRACGYEDIVPYAHGLENYGVETARLRIIPPLSELEQEESKFELKISRSVLAQRKLMLEMNYWQSEYEKARKA